MARGNRGGESKRGIIVTLVFFILATIGLGVATYYGFAEKDQIKQAQLEAEKKQKAAEAERDVWRFQTEMLKGYFGFAPQNPAGLASDYQQFQSNSLGSANPQNSALMGTAKPLIKKLNDTLPWNPDIAQPTRTGRDPQPMDMFKLLAERDATVQQLQKDKIAALSAQAKAEGELKRVKDEITTAQTAFLAKVKELEKGNAANLAEYLRKLNLAEKSFKDINTEKFDKAIELSQQVANLNKDKRALEKLLREQRDKINRLESVVARRNEDKPIIVKPQGKVIRLSSDGKRAYIDMGSKDGLKPQVTFSVYALANNGKPKANPKGTVEVIDVGTRTSEVVITRMFAGDDKRDYFGRRASVDVLSKENRDPIQRGDVIINPTWNPNLKTHIAIAGIVDFLGDGYNHVETFIRNLEKQNIIVDAYMDARDGSIKGGGITQRTDMLVLASAPDFGSLTGRNKARAETMLKTMAELQKTAEKNGLSQVKLRRFIEEIGYRVPRYAQRR